MNVDYTRGEGNRGTGLVAIKTGCVMLGLRIHPWGLLSLLAVTLSLYERYQKKRHYETKYQVAVKESIVDIVFLPKLSCVSRCIDIQSSVPSFQTVRIVLANVSRIQTYDCAIT